MHYFIYLFIYINYLSFQSLEPEDKLTVITFKQGILFPTLHGM